MGFKNYKQLSEAYNVHPSTTKEVEALGFPNIGYLVSLFSKLRKDFPDILEPLTINPKDKSKIKLKRAIEDPEQYNGEGFSFTSGEGSRTKGSSDKTTLQEVAFLIILDMINSGIRPEIENLDTYQYSSKMKVSANVNEVINFLKENPLWFDSNKVFAEATSKKFDISNYDYHHDSREFKKIRSHGRKVSNASSADKWNPSDVYLIRNMPEFVSDVIKYNENVWSEDNCVGISLKKGDNEALHGSYSIKNMVERKGLKLGKKISLEKYKGEPIGRGKKEKKFSVSDQDIKSLISNINNVDSSLRAKTFVSLSNNTNNMKDSLKLAQIFSENWGQSVPIIMHFLAQLKSNWEEIIKEMVFVSLSVDFNSCSYWKTSGNGLKIVPQEQPAYDQIEIKDVLFKLNGDTNVVFNITYLGKQMYAQIRSKGSLPQMIIINGNVSASGMTALSSLG